MAFVKRYTFGKQRHWYTSPQAAFDAADADQTKFGITELIFLEANAPDPVDNGDDITVTAASGIMAHVATPTGSVTDKDDEARTAIVAIRNGLIALNLMEGT